jgi:hypothetical protein
MRSSVSRWSVALVVLGTVAAGTSLAQAREVELTLVGGLRTGGSYDDGTTGASRPADDGPAFGLILGFPLGPDRTFELVWIHQPVSVPPVEGGGDDFDLTLDTLAVGGTSEWGSGKVRPFVSATAGLALLDPDAAGYDLELLFTGSLGAGFKVPVSPKVGLRFEGRGVALLSTGGAAGICGPSGCALAFAGAGLGQLELLAGIAVAF